MAVIPIEPTGLVIRAERAEDEAAIHHLITAAFHDAPHSSGTEAAIVDALRDGGKLALSLVAEDRGVIVGYVAFSPVDIDGVSTGWFGLGPVAVQPIRQRFGIGRALIEDGLQQLRNDGACGCVVLGDPAYYRRFGFAADPALRYPGVPAVYFQHIRFSGPSPSGTVTYDDAFNA